MPLRTELGPATNKALAEVLAAERTAGFSVEHGMVTAGYSSVAAAAVNHLGIPVAAFGVTFRSEAMQPEPLLALQQEIATKLKPVATELSRRLGAK